MKEISGRLKRESILSAMKSNRLNPMIFSKAEITALTAALIISSIMPVVLSAVEGRHGVDCFIPTA